jgi:ferritin-like metal-binding protein YciE
LGSRQGKSDVPNEPLRATERRGTNDAAPRWVVAQIATKTSPSTQALRACTNGPFLQGDRDDGRPVAHQLKDIYLAEKRIAGALPDMTGKATSSQLKSALESHLGEMRNHVTRLDRVFQMHGFKPESVDCPAIDGIIEEADEVAGEVDDKNVLDAALIAAAQADEHYEMTRHGTLIAWAKLAWPQRLRPGAARDLGRGRGRGQETH